MSSNDNLEGTLEKITITETSDVNDDDLSQLKVENINLKHQLDAFSDENIFNVEVVKNVVDRYKIQVVSLKNKVQIGAAANANLEKQNKDLLIMNESFTTQSQQQTKIIESTSIECDKLQQENEALKNQLKEFKSRSLASNSGMFGSTSSPESIEINQLMSRNHSTDYLTFTEDPHASITSVTTTKNTEDFLYEHQMLKKKCIELEESLEQLPSDANRLSKCEMCANKIDKCEKLEKYNMTLQSIITELHDKCKVQDNKINELSKINEDKKMDEELYREQAKAFQEDFDSERKEKAHALEEKRNLKKDNDQLLRRCESLEQENARLRNHGFMPSTPPNMNSPYPPGPSQYGNHGRPPPGSYDYEQTYSSRPPYGGNSSNNY